MVTVDGNINVNSGGDYNGVGGFVMSVDCRRKNVSGTTTHNTTGAVIHRLPIDLNRKEKWHKQDRQKV